MCFANFYEVEEDAPNEIDRPDSRPESEDEESDHIIVAALRNDPFFILVRQNSNTNHSLSWFIYLQLRYWWFVNRGLIRDGGNMLDYFESLGRDGALRYFRLHGAPPSVARAWRRVYFGPEPRETLGAVYLEDMPSTDDESSDDEPGVPFDDADTGDYYLVPLFLIKSEDEGENEIIDIEDTDEEEDDIIEIINVVHIFEEDLHLAQYYADDEDEDDVDKDDYEEEDQDDVEDDDIDEDDEDDDEEEDDDDEEEDDNEDDEVNEDSDDEEDKADEN